MRIELKRLDDAYHFEAKNAEGNTIHFDASPEIGGHNKGVRPMQTLLMAMGSCSAIDVVTILKKQKQEVSGFEIIIDGEREQGKDISLWKTAHVHFKLTGKIDKEKAERAVQLSMEKYCSVSKTLEKAGATITYEVSINN